VTEECEEAGNSIFLPVYFPASAGTNLYSEAHVKTCLDLLPDTNSAVNRTRRHLI